MEPQGWDDFQSHRAGMISSSSPTSGYRLTLCLTERSDTQPQSLDSLGEGQVDLEVTHFAPSLQICSQAPVLNVNSQHELAGDIALPSASHSLPHTEKWDEPSV